MTWQLGDYGEHLKNYTIIHLLELKTLHEEGSTTWCPRFESIITFHSSPSQGLPDLKDPDTRNSDPMTIII